MRMVFASMVAAGAVLASTPAIIPAPVSLRLTSGVFQLGPDTAIVVTNDTNEIGEALRDELRPATGFALPVRRKGGRGTIRLRLDKGLARLGDEGYRLKVQPDGVEISGYRPAGVFYGVQTLRQMLPAAIFRRAPVEGQEWSVPCAEIEDQPRFGWRGAHLDVARHFMPKEWVLKFIDVLALHKMNVLHWHLTDDQGWRIEIKKYPRLTEVGAWRKDTMLTYQPRKFEGKPHGGYYTQDDVREVVAYAAKRFVTVVPEIEMPGHAQAAIAAYPELGNLAQPLEVGTEWGVIENIFNVEDHTISFLQDVLTEVMGLFPSTFIHVGGDEVPKKQWQESPAAQAKLKALGLKDEHELQSWFMKQMDTFLVAHNRRMIGWDEILEGGLAPNAAVMSWQGEEGGITAARAGHDVVMAPHGWTYYDSYPTRHRENEPHAIGGYTSLEKAYKYEPIPAALSPEEARHVLGAQGQLWTEYMPNPRHVEYMAFPRMLAMSEIVWSPKEARNYEGFRQRLEADFERLKVLDVNFRMPKADD